MKATLTKDRTLMFWCPGCEDHHGVPVDGSRGWQWNGSLESPTVTPSILVKGVVPITDDEHAKIMAGEKIEPVPRVCHSFVTDGKIQFLDDCTHSLKGQTVELPDVDAIPDRFGERV